MLFRLRFQQETGAVVVRHRHDGIDDANTVDFDPDRGIVVYGRTSDPDGVLRQSHDPNPGSASV